MYDQFICWRIEERYIKAGYKLTDISIGKELLSLVPKLREEFNLVAYDNGVFEITMDHVTCFLVKTEDKIMIGTYPDHCTTPAGKKLINEFIATKFGKAP